MRPRRPLALRVLPGAADAHVDGQRHRERGEGADAVDLPLDGDEAPVDMIYVMNIVYIARYMYINGYT